MNKALSIGKRILINFCFLILSSLLFSACASVPRFTSAAENTENSNSVVEEEYKLLDENTEPLESVVGIASFYAEPFDKKETASGEIYDKYALTAAHYSYPFNTMIRVTNLTNNKMAFIRINDRMPKHPARIIDLSYGTALQLDMISEGLAKIRLDILQWGEE